MEQVRVRIGDDEILVSWHPPDRPPEGQRHGAEGMRVTDSGEVIVVSRDGGGRTTAVVTGGHRIAPGGHASPELCRIGWDRRHDGPTLRIRNSSGRRR